MTQPLVSVLTPSYNHGRWLRDNLESVRRQTYPWIEHIVVDGGSTDGTVEILKESAARWVSEPDRGQSHALNKAFALSSGDIIGWVNSDDAYYSTEAAAWAVAAFERQPDAAVVYGHSALVDGAGRLLHYNWAPPFSRRLMLRSNFIIQPATFVRRRALEGVFVDERFDYTMDRELWLRLSCRFACIRVPHVLAIDRHHDLRKSYTRPDLYLHDLSLLMEEYGVPGISHRNRAAVKIAKICLRLAGLPLALRTREQLGVALPLVTPSTRELIIHQVLMTRKAIAAKG